MSSAYNRCERSPHMSSSSNQRITGHSQERLTDDRCDHVIHLVVRALTYRTGNRRRVEGSQVIFRKAFLVLDGPLLRQERPHLCYQPVVLTAVTSTRNPRIVAAVNVTTETSPTGQRLNLAHGHGRGSDGQGWLDVGLDFSSRIFPSSFPSDG